jgi:hypothetical protein
VNADLGNGQGRLTQEKHIFRLALLNLALACVKHGGNARLPQGGVGGYLSLPMPNEQFASGYFRFQEGDTGLPGAGAGAFGSRASQENFQDLRAMSMTKNERAQAAIPHQDTRNLSCRAWVSSPRGAMKNKTVGSWLGVRRKRHGIARATENLRGMRLSLVSQPEPGRRLLLQV